MAAFICWDFKKLAGKLYHAMRIFWAVIFSMLWVGAAIAQQRTLIVRVNEPKAEIKPSMWGIFFEDINFAADGGLYAELVKNRSFEFPMPMMGWHEIAGKGST